MLSSLQGAGSEWRFSIDAVYGGEDRTSIIGKPPSIARYLAWHGFPWDNCQTLGRLAWKDVYGETQERGDGDVPSHSIQFQGRDPLSAVDVKPCRNLVSSPCMISRAIALALPAREGWLAAEDVSACGLMGSAHIIAKRWRFYITESLI
jgi:hypothetical protein